MNNERAKEMAPWLSTCHYSKGPKSGSQKPWKKQQVLPVPEDLILLASSDDTHTHTQMELENLLNLINININKNLNSFQNRFAALRGQKRHWVP